MRVGVQVVGHGESTYLVHFVLDTGSTKTVVHPLDALLSLGISLTDLETDELWDSSAEIAGVGGFGTVRETRASLTFEHEDGSSETMAINLNLAVPDDNNLSLPSLLGWDVLKHFRLEMDYDADLVALHSNSAQTMRVP